MVRLNLRRRIHFYEVFNVTVWTLILTIFALTWLLAGGYGQGVQKYDQTLIAEVFWAVVAVVLSVFIFHLVYDGLLHVLLQRRNKQLALRAFTRGMSLASVIPLSPTVLQLADRKYDAHQRNVYTDKDWGFCDFQFSVMRKNKYRYFRAKTYYYSVAVFMLPRKLPNVFFDSKKTGGREFGMRFRKSQRHSLEGDFDTYFTTYFHDDYTIDDLSFITPEIMHTLIETKGYDIEIYEDKLYLYNEIENMPLQLDAVEHFGKQLREKLLHNIMAYRDDRIAADIGRKTVSVYGVRLRRSTGFHYAKGTVFVFILLVSIGAFTEKAFSGFAVYGVVIGIGGVLRELMTLREILVDEGLRRKHKHIGV